MRLVVAGLANKEIALEVDISEKTVNVHRSQVMNKMRAAARLQASRGRCELLPAAVQSQRP